MCSGGGAPSPRNTFLRPGGGRIFPSEHFFCDPAARPSALHPAAAFGRGRGGGRLAMPPLPPGGRPVPSAPLNSPSRPYPAPLNTLAPPPPAPQNPRLFRPRPAPGPTAEHAGPAPAPPQNPLHRPRPAPLNTLAPPPGSTAEPPAPPCPAPLNALVPPRLHRRTPSPSPSRAAEHAGPLPVGAPETSPEGPQHAPESPFRGHLSKSRPRSWVFRGIFRTFGCKWMQKMSFAANNIIRIS